MKLPRLMQNRITYLGAAIAALALAVFAFLLALHTFGGAGAAPYAGIVVFVVTPSFVALGLAVAALGILIEWRRRRRSLPSSASHLPVIDLNDSHQQQLLLVFGGGGLLLLLLSVFGSYQTYHLTESVEFCGTVCHTVMKPEFTAYQHSPHARVSCVDCHVGAGASWYVKSKLSGAYQVYAVLSDRFPRPIPTPITSLRPAQETCEQCHWPRQFFGGQQKQFVHYMTDEDNTRHVIELLIKIGGGNPAGGPTEGIHWHMNVQNRVDYIATDPERQVIPWVRVTNRETGEVTEYVSREQPLSAEELAQATPRQMDCMDCHNRPTHIFRSPSHSVNLAIEEKRIDADLPFVKRTAVELLTASHGSSEAGLEAIGRGLEEFYRKEYAEIARTRSDAIARAAAEVQEIYRRTFFPEMKVRWDTYADNVGHLISPGCTRCHDGLHQTEDGRVLSNECRTCHIILSQGSAEKMSYAATPEGLDFEHPVDIGGAWQFMNCGDCHSGGLP